MLRRCARFWLSRRLFVLIAVSYAYFYQGGDPNQISRLELTRAIVERHALDMAHPSLTIDKAGAGGRYFSDKAPLVSFLAAAPYAVARAAERLAGLDGDTRAVQQARFHAVVFAVVGVAGVLAAYFLRRALLDLGTPRRFASFLAVAYALGTPAFPFSTVFFSHEVAAALLIALFCSMTRARTRPPSVARAVTLGFLTSAAFVCEYPTAIALAVLWLWFLATAARPTLVRTLSLAAAGAALPLAAHAAYDLATFGRALDLPYAHVVEPVFAAGGLRLGNIAVSSVAGLSVSPFRGLFFFFSPVLALSFAGFGFWLRRGESRDVALVAAGVFGASAVFTASFYYWDGGMSVGPRHLVPVLPFLVLPLGYVVREGRAWVGLTVALAAVSIVFMFACTAVRVELPGDEKNPLYDVVASSLARGELSINDEDPFEQRPRADASYNLGQLVGLSRGVSLAVLPIAWALAFAWPRRRRAVTS